MFFRNQKQIAPAFETRLDQLRSAGLTVSGAGSGKARVNRNHCAAVIEDRGEGKVHVNKAGVMSGDEIGMLVHGGYQMFWTTPSGKTVAALSRQLKELHAFEEDLKEGLGLTSLYNESLGTVCDEHLYDRVLNRDHGVPARAWQK